MFLNDGNLKSKFCLKSTVGWVLGVILIALLVIESIEFLYPTFRIRFGQEHIQIYQDPTLQMKMMPPMKTDYVHGEIQKVPKKEPWDMEFLIDPYHLCTTRRPSNSQQYQQDPEVKLLMMVHSPTDHFKQRMAIRNTWGSIAEKNLGIIRLGFVLGTTKNRTEDVLIKDESCEYKDIIQADFEDTYCQKTTKSIIMLKWVARRCPHAQYFLKADDDTFVNLGIVAYILSSEPFISEDKFIAGYVHRGFDPSRIQDEYYVSEYVSPDEEYPSYTFGSAYVMTGPTAVELFQASKDMPLLPMEDIYVTGLCAQEINAKLLHDPRFGCQDSPDPPSWQAFSSVASAPHTTPEVLELVWKDMARSNSNLLLNQEVAINATDLIRRKRRSLIMKENLFT